MKYLLYIGDAWLSTRSLELIAVCDTLEHTIPLAKEFAKSENEPLDEQAENFLATYFQTQGRDTNFLIELIELNTLID